MIDGKKIASGNDSPIGTDLIFVESHRPLDVIVLTLGTNDLKARFGNPVEDIAAGVGILASIIAATPNQGNPAKLLIVCPPPGTLLGVEPSRLTLLVETAMARPGTYSEFSEPAATTRRGRRPLTALYPTNEPVPPPLVLSAVVALA